MPLTARSTRVKEARRLARRTQRVKLQRFLVEGPQAVREALRTPGRVLEVYVSDAGAAHHPELVTAATQAGVGVHSVTDEAIAALAETVTPQGLVAVCRLLPVPLAQALSPRSRLVVVLAEARDPGNAGAVIRTADAAGADAVILSAGSVDVHNGKCVRASAGSVFHLPIVADVALPAIVDALHAAGLTVLAADADGEHDLYDLEGSGVLAGRVAWLFGNEAWGLPEAAVKLADRVVRVPIYGCAESLNLATAAAVCLYGSARAQRKI